MLLRKLSFVLLALLAISPFTNVMAQKSSSQSVSTHNVVLKDISGKDIALNDYKGKWIFINYWASWCQPCVEEISALNRFYQKNKARAAVLAINYERLSVKQQLQLIKQHRIHYLNLLNDPAKPLHLAPIVALPTTFVFNPEGKFSDTLVGPQTLSSLNRAMK